MSVAGTTTRQLANMSPVIRPSAADELDRAKRVGRRTSSLLEDGEAVGLGGEAKKGRDPGRQRIQDERLARRPRLGGELGGEGVEHLGRVLEAVRRDEENDEDDELERGHEGEEGVQMPGAQSDDAMAVASEGRDCHLICRGVKPGAFRRRRDAHALIHRPNERITTAMRSATLRQAKTKHARPMASSCLVRASDA